jgi:hypothetical protein
VTGESHGGARHRPRHRRGAGELLVATAATVIGTLIAPADRGVEGLDGCIHKINYSAIQGLGQVQVTSRGVRGSALTPRQDAAGAGGGALPAGDS